LSTQGEVEAFLQLLAEDVTFVPDGGGERGAAIRMLRGREAVASFIFGVQKIAPTDLRYDVAMLNGQPAILVRMTDGKPFFVVFLYYENETVTLVHVIAGHKLSNLTKQLIATNKTI